MNPSWVWPRYRMLLNTPVRERRHKIDKEPFSAAMTAASNRVEKTHKPRYLDNNALVDVYVLYPITGLT